MVVEIIIAILAILIITFWILDQDKDKAKICDDAFWYAYYKPK